MTLMADQDGLLSSHPMFRFDTWQQQARAACARPLRRHKNLALRARARSADRDAAHPVDTAVRMYHKYFGE